MGNLFRLYAKRIVNQCGHHYYTEPVIHKDRVMSTHDFIYLSQGKWELYQNDASYLLEPGDLLILHSGQRHYCINPCLPETEIFYFHILPHPEDSYVTNRIDAVNYASTLIHCKNYPDIREIIDKIPLYFWKNTEIGRAELSALSNLLLCRLCEISKSSNSKHDETLEEAVQFIHMHPDRFIHISELAEMLYVSEKTLRQKFVKAYNKTPHQYQMNLKLMQAKKILQHNPEILLHEISQQSGFYDEFHFSKCFKRKYGLSPSACRKQSKGQFTE